MAYYVYVASVYVPVIRFRTLQLSNVVPKQENSHDKAKDVASK